MASAGRSTDSARNRGGRWFAVFALGPLTALAGLVWLLAQPYRITLLHPQGKGFWWLAVEPPLLVIAVGVVFHLFVARSLLRELDAEGPRPR